MSSQSLPSLPVGLRLELTRHQVIPGQSAAVDEWMAMLNDRIDECRVTLDPERMAVEAVFRLRDEQGEWLYWFELAGDNGTGLTQDRPIDRDHVASPSARRCQATSRLSLSCSCCLRQLSR